MKRILAIMLPCLMVFVLVGCSGKTPASEENTEAPSPEIAEEVIDSGEREADMDTSPPETSPPETSPPEQTTEASSPSGAQEPGSAEPVTIKMGIPPAPPALPVLYMMEYGTVGEDVTIEFDMWDEAENLIAMVQDGEHDMFAFPLTVVAKLHNKGVDVQLMNVNTWGVTYFLTSDPELKDWGDLKGKTVYVPIQSSPPDVLTQFFLDEAGLVVGQDVEIVYANITEVASMLISGDAQYATLIEPQVTRALMQNENLRVAFSFEDEWKRLQGKDDSLIPTAGIGAMSSFISDHPEITARFQAAYAEGVQWVNDNPEEAGKLAEKYLPLDAQLVTKAIPSMGLLFKSAQDAKPDVETFYTLINNFDNTMIGGKLPDNSMYYEG